MSKYEKLPKAPVEISTAALGYKVNNNLTKLIQEIFDRRFPNQKYHESAHYYYSIISGRQYIIPFHFETSHFIASFSITLMMENLKTLNMIPSHPIFDGQNQVRTYADIEECRTLFRSGEHQGIFNGLKIGVIGGPEAEIFHALGAEAVGINPLLSKLPAVEKPGLTEISNRLESSLAKNFQGMFDVTYSSRLFDSGSGLTGRFNSDNDTYASCLNLILDMTKPNGLSIHNGNLLPYTLPLINSSQAKVLNIIPQVEGDKWGKTDMWVTLQKAA